MVRGAFGVLVATVLLGGAFSGCLSSGASVPPPPFDDALAQANVAALEWSPNAVLALAGTLEADGLALKEEAPRGQWFAEPLAKRATDGEIGDAQGLYWHFLYWDPGDHRQFSVFVTDRGVEAVVEYSGKAWYRGSTELPQLHAAQRHKTPQAAISELASEALEGEEPHFVWWALVPELVTDEGSAGSGPLWVVFLTSKNAAAVLSVNAQGHAAPLGFDLLGGLTRYASAVGLSQPDRFLAEFHNDEILTVAEPKRTIRFEVTPEDIQYGHESISWLYCTGGGGFMDPIPDDPRHFVRAGSVRFTMTAPDGSLMEDRTVELGSGMTSSWNDWPLRQPGTYEATIELVDGVAADYRHRLVVASPDLSQPLKLSFSCPLDEDSR